MSPGIKKLIVILGIALMGCCVFSTALLFLAPTNERPADRQVSGISDEISEAAATTEDNPTPTNLPATSLSLTTQDPIATKLIVTSAPANLTATRTRPPTHTPVPIITPAPTDTQPPTYTPLPTRTPIPLPTPTILLTSTPTSLPTATSLPGEIATVIGIIDGDTIIVDLNGTTWRVRYIGIDTPEAGRPCGSEATSANSRLVDGKTIRMVRDVRDTDRYGRLLRYVYVGDMFVNRQLAAGGWAIAKDYPPDTSMSDVLHAAARDGINLGCALVAGALPTVPPRAPSAPVAPVAPVAPPAATQPVPQPTAPPQGGNCDPSYPTVCIPPPPPDLDCGDIPYRRFQVLPPDPHNFDGSDNDGIGCESG